jgi:hypothetical protein
MGDPGFEIELRIASGDVVSWEMTGDWLRGQRHPAVAYDAAQGREGEYVAAIRTLRSIFDNRKKDESVEVTDKHGDFWIIQGSAVVAVRLHDLTGGAKHPVGFSVPAGEAPQA